MHMKSLASHALARSVSALCAPPPADAVALVQELHKAFDEFKAANDQRYEEMKAGKADVVLNDKVDRINADMTRIQTALDTALGEMNHFVKGGGSRDPENELKVRTAAAAFFAGKSGVEDAKITDGDVQLYLDYCAALPQFLRRGMAMNDPKFLAAMSVGSESDGGVWVTGQMMTTVIKRLFETSPIRSIAEVITITTDSVTWPNDTNDGTSGGWVGETATRGETNTPQVGDQTIYVREQFAMPIVTQKLLDMATVNVEQWLAMKIADKLARTENTAFVSGDGIAKPRGFLDYKTAALTTDDSARVWGILQYVASGAAGAFPTLSDGASDPDRLIDLVAKLNPAYRAGASWVMSRATEAAIRKLKDGDGNYFIGTITNAAVGFQLLGFPIVTAEDMPALASDSYSVAFGNFREGYQIVDGRGIRVLRDNLTTKGKVKFYTTKWTGGDVKNFDAIKLMKFAA